ncbi:MAG: VWA domain-containing protein [Eubacteriales bacterium]
MSFHPEQYAAQEKKILPVLLLLDVSGSMAGEKIEALNECASQMIKTFATAPENEVEIQVAIITFCDQVAVHTKFESAQTLVGRGWLDLVAGGRTCLGGALDLGYQMLEDRTVLPRAIYRPAVVVVSDGKPTDQWEAPLERFITEGRASKSQRFAIPIGADVQKEPLERFTGCIYHVFPADNVEKLKAHFAYITQTLSQRSGSVNPNVVATPPTAQNSDPSQSAQRVQSILSSGGQQPTSTTEGAPSQPTDPLVESYNYNDDDI